MSPIVCEFEAVCLHCKQTGIVCQVCGAFLLHDYSKEHVHDANTGELITPNWTPKSTDSPSAAPRSSEAK